MEERSMYEYKHYATYIFMKKSRGIIRIDSYDHNTGQLEISIAYGEPEREEAMTLINQTINSGGFLTVKDEYLEELIEPENIEGGSMIPNMEDDGINFLDD